MKNSRLPVFIGFGALIVIGTALLLWPFLNLPQMIPPRFQEPTDLPPGAAPYPNVKRLKVGDARAAYEAKQAVFIDVRDKASYDRGHIPGALSLPLSELDNRLGELDKQQWIIAYCT